MAETGETKMMAETGETKMMAENEETKMMAENGEKATPPEDQVLQLPLSKLELNDFISSVVKKLVPQDANNSSKRQLLYASLQVSKAERKAKEISKTFSQSLEKVQRYLEEVKAEEKGVEDEIQKKEMMIMRSCEIIDDDSDDDVTITGSSFEPAKRTTQLQNIPLNKPGHQNPTSAQPLMVQTPQMQVGSIISGSGNAPPTLANLRAALTNTLNKQQAGGPQIIAVAEPKQRSVGQGVDLGKEYTIPVWTELAVGSRVLAKKFNDIWYSGIITDLAKPEGSKHAGEWKFRVKFDGKGLKVLTGHHIAYRDSIAPNTFLKVGTRVAALYRDDESTSSSSFYAGIVAEAPSFKNQKRFLVFFDDGYAQYCWAKELHKVYYQSDNVWEDIHPDSQEFIKEYLKQYPERPMVRLMDGQVVKTEWNGRWWTAKVMEVDASLVKMYFQADKRTEWIYRGSTRLEPLFKALANAEAIKAAGSSKGRRLNMDTKGVKKPTVEYTRPAPPEGDKKAASTSKTVPSKTPTPASSSASASVPSSASAPAPVPGEGEKKRPVARKSTGNGNQFRPNRGPRSMIAEDSFPGFLEGWKAPWLKINRRQQQASQQKKIPNSGHKGFEASSISSNKQGRDMASVLQERLSTVDQGHSECIDDGEALGERMDTVIDTKGKERKKFVPHTCCPQCVKEMEEDKDKHIGKNPLLFPLLCGWERQITKMRPTARKGVMYRAPCGRRLRSIEEVDDFLAITDSQLYIDHFCFDAWLHVHTEFVPVKTFCDIKDLSYGKEKVPISCVNAIDRQYPDYVEYSSYRIPAKGVKIPLDDEFLQCCDCTDNCRDASKCACQQLTIENTTWIGERNLEAGYQHRLLKEPIFTGVVECNARCKCDHRCRNRVAQNGLSCRLQVFKTEKRGWGLRCLNDIPKGGFICIYAGQLLTDTGANDDGKQYGDEYLAELDFIEVVERQKEGYESDVEDDIVNDNPEEDEEEEDYRSDNEMNDGRASSDSDFEAGGSGGVETKVHATRRRKRASEADHKDGKANQPLSKLVLKRQSTEGGNWTREEKKTEQPGGKADKMNDSPIEIGDDDDDDDSDIKAKEEPMETEELPDLDKPVQVKKKEDEGKTELKVEEDDSEMLSETDSKMVHKSDSMNLSHRARKSTGGSRFKNLPNPKMAGTIPEAEEENEKPKQGTRSFFKDSSSCYIMDAKSMGNIGRYLNHSCSPNVFVQNIFVDTHDLRFPWVAFFAGQYIRAGMELTWDYNYEVGSVPDKVLYCYCGSPMCRGRLL